MLPTQLDELFSDFNAMGVIWALLRAPSKYAPKSGDIDLLIHPNHLGRATQCITAHGFVRLPGWKPDFHYLYYDDFNDQWIWIHITTQLSYGSMDVLQNGITLECLERHQQIDGVYQLAPCDAFWELLLHCLIEKGAVSPKHAVRLQELVANRPQDSSIHNLIDTTLQPQYSSVQMIQLVYQGDWTGLNNSSPAIAHLWKNRTKNQPVRLFLNRAMLRLQRFSHLFQNRGLGVAIIGPDGAGKSTLIAEMEKGVIFPVQVVYMGLTGGWLPYADRIRFPLFVIPLRLMIFWGRYMRAWYYRLKGNLVLFDRYIYDYLVPTPYQQTRLQKLIRWIDGHSCPGPDLVLILDAPGDIMHKRKGEYNPEMLEDWRQHFLALQSIKPNTVRIDASVSIEDMKIDAIRNIWSMYRVRWKRIEQYSARNP